MGAGTYEVVIVYRVAPATTSTLFERDVVAATEQEALLRAALELGHDLASKKHPASPQRDVEVRCLAVMRRMN